MDGVVEGLLLQLLDLLAFEGVLVLELGELLVLLVQVVLLLLLY